jgi:tetratricopeptide (TPR) repeat protein
MFVNNIGYTGFLVGDWDQGLAEMEGVLSDDLDRVDRLALLANALIIRTNRGEMVDDGMRELEALVAGDTDPGNISMILDARANAALAGGRLADARATWRELAEIQLAFGPSAIYQGARGALWEHDVDAVRADLAALDATGVHGPIVEVRRTTLRAGLAALEGRAAEAAALYREALRGWRELGIVWDEVLTSIDMATLLDPADPEVRAAAASSREILSRLGARPYLDRLDEAMARPAPAAEGGSVTSGRPSQAAATTPTG